MGQTDNFFEKKKGWSLLKDEIIDCYLTPYITKILSTNRPLFIFDCFAGKGRFDCGLPGSPIIIGEHIKSILGNESRHNKEIHGKFIEKKYANELKENIEEYENCNVLDGTFEDNIGTILDLDEHINIFLYVDPYGPKSLPFELFHQINKKKFKSLELLMNFNCFGFLREGCRILKYNEAFNEMLKHYESEEWYEIEESNDVEEMTQIANGNYWIEILNKYNNNEIEMLEAEELFADKYRLEIKQLFKYAINIPIKTNSNLIPKYRLIFGTNHDDGLILMANQMNKGWKRILEHERDGQDVLFEYIFPDMTVFKGVDLEDGIVEMIRNSGNEILLKMLIVNLIQEYGISFSEAEYIQKFKEMEGDKLIILREPEFTRTGRRASSMDYDKYKITLKLI